jgi:hypothetical protein
MKLPSSSQINDDVYFRPMYRHQQTMGIADETFEGKVMAVKFTEAKIYYDIYSPYHGVIFDGVDSVKVWSDNYKESEIPPSN